MHIYIYIYILYFNSKTVKFRPNDLINPTNNQDKTLYKDGSH